MHMSRAAWTCPEHRLAYKRRRTCWRAACHLLFSEPAFPQLRCREFACRALAERAVFLRASRREAARGTVVPPQPTRRARERAQLSKDWWEQALPPVAGLSGPAGEPAPSAAGPARLN